MVRRLQLHKAGGHIHLRAKHLKHWLREDYPSEGKSTPPRKERWKNLVESTHFMWQQRDILRELGWTILLLTPNGNTDTRVIGLLESLWKMVEAIINTHLRAGIES